MVHRVALCDDACCRIALHCGVVCFFGGLLCFVVLCGVVLCFVTFHCVALRCVVLWCAALWCVV